MAAKPKPRMIGSHIVADPAVCHGSAHIPGDMHPGLGCVGASQFRNGLGEYCVGMA